MSDMWFLGTKRGNRRRGRAATVRVELPGYSGRAVGGLGLIARLLLLVVVVFGSGVLIWLGVERVLDHFLYRNPSFALREVEVLVTGRLGPEQVRRLSGLEPGENVFSVDLRAVKRNLELVSQVKLATVERVLPDKIRIRVVERDPVARVFVPGVAPGGSGLMMSEMFVDEEGYLFSFIESDARAGGRADRRLECPLIVGLSGEQLVLGGKLRTPEALSAVELIRAYERSAMLGVDELRLIDVSSPGVLVVQMASGAEVTFGTARIPQQLRRLREVYELGRQLGRRVAFVDLAVTNNLPVGWAEPGASAVREGVRGAEPSTKREKNA